MKNLKRLLATVSAMIIGATYLTAGVSKMELNVNAESAVQASTSNNQFTLGKLTYAEKSDGTLSVVSCDKSATKVDIPNEVGGLIVTSIGEGAFRNCAGLFSVTIPENVTHIYSYAFKGCVNLKNIEIPRYVVAIYNQVFTGTRWLMDRQAENPLVIVNNHLIDGTTASGDVVIPDGIRSIGYEAFNGNRDITSVTIPSSLWTIGYYAFCNCKNLQKVILPDENELAYISTGAFVGCASLTDIKIPESVSTIKGGAFYETPWLAAKQEENPFVIINGMLIDGTAVSGVATIPEEVETISAYAFGGSIYVRNNTELISITIPDTVKEIDEGAFSDCTALERVIIKNPNCYIRDPMSDTGITIPKIIKIFGYKESTAHDYALDYGNDFEALHEKPPVIKGDLTGDGELTVADLVIMRKFLMGCKVSVDDWESMDMNSDGKVNIFDFVMMKRLYGAA